MLPFFFTLKKPFPFVTTVHKDLTERLKEANPSLYGEVRKLLDQNKEERHIRGGLATKRKYSLQRESKGK